MRQQTITQERLKETLDYDRHTGIFTWKVKCGSANPGQRAGTLNHHGYRYIKLDGKRYREHALAILYVFNHWPDRQVDHRNGVRDDNRIYNLGTCFQHENQQNRKKQSGTTSLYIGVSYSKQAKKWRAAIRVNGVNHDLGYFWTETSARDAYLAAKEELHQYTPVPRSRRGLN